MKTTVLILHNIPAGGGFAESDAGIIAEVNAVAESLQHLNIPHRTAGVSNLADVQRTLASSPESIVFNLVESMAGSPTDANLVPALCKAAGKASTGSDTPSLLITLDKSHSKAILADAGLPCPAGICIQSGHFVDTAALPPPPWIVKPARSDASEGIDAASVVHEIERLEEVVRRVHQRCGQPAIVEQFIGGREFNVSLVQQRAETGDRQRFSAQHSPTARSAEPSGKSCLSPVSQQDGEILVLPVAEIVFTLPDGKPPIVDYAAKWLTDTVEYKNTRRVVPAEVDNNLAEEIRRIALGAWRVLDCRDYVRVDMRTDDAGHPFILEVNANPDISPDAGFAAALAAAGISYDEFVRRIVHNAAERLPNDQASPTLTAAGSGNVTARVHHPAPDGISIRRTIIDDRQPLLKLVEATKFFRPDELETAREVLDEAVKHGEEGHYQSFTAIDANGSPAGWVCYGPTPCTIGTFDIYWIAVDITRQSHGIGSSLLAFAEDCIRQRGGRLAVAETSGQPRYESTRHFYLRNGYTLSAQIPDFYAPGDDKLVYTKNLGQ